MVTLTIRLLYSFGSDSPSSPKACNLNRRTGSCYFKQTANQLIYVTVQFPPTKYQLTNENLQVIVKVADF